MLHSSKSHQVILAMKINKKTTVRLADAPQCEAVSWVGLDGINSVRGSTHCKDRAEKEEEEKYRRRTLLAG